jgi:micrococcal nuclease
MEVRSFLRVLVLALFALPSVCIADEFTGRVLRVPDGDSVLILRDGTTVEVRLHGIDCPERGQAYGGRAARFTSARALGKTVTVRGHDLDQYGRTLGDVVLRDGTVLNRELVRAGLCWWYRHYSDDATLGDLEAEARKAKRGLWQDPFPVPPWDYRRSQRSRAVELAEGAPPDGGTRSVPDPAPPVSSDNEFPIVGNTRSRIYHLPECPDYSRVSARHRIPFASEQAAKAAGYRRAKNCP